jgi:hypothetical protein
MTPVATDAYPLESASRRSVDSVPVGARMVRKNLMRTRRKVVPHPDVHEDAPEKACNSCREPRILCNCGKSDNTGAGPWQSASGKSAIVRDSLPTALLHKLMCAPPEQFSAVQRLLATPPGMNGANGTRRRSFESCGDHWKVIFDGRELHLAQSLGARYLDHLLHRPNQLIAAFDLERAIVPAKASARAINSSDAADIGECMRQYLRKLEHLRAERDEATEQGDFGGADRFDEDITLLEAQLRQGRRTHDTGERARNNVRKAIGAVVRGLQRGDAAQKLLALHLGRFVDTGYACVYHQPPGAEWA